MLALWYMAVAYQLNGQYEPALRFMRKASETGNQSPFLLSYVARFLAEAGELQQAEQILDELQRKSASEYIAPLDFARILMGLRRNDEAFVHLHRAVAEENVMMYLICSPEWDPLRSDPRYSEILRLLNWPA